MVGLKVYAVVGWGANVWSGVGSGLEIVWDWCGGGEEGCSVWCGDEFRGT